VISLAFALAWFIIGHVEEEVSEP